MSLLVCGRSLFRPPSACAKGESLRTRGGPSLAAPSITAAASLWWRRGWAQRRYDGSSPGAGGPGLLEHRSIVTIVDMDAERWDDLAKLMGERAEPIPPLMPVPPAATAVWKGRWHLLMS